MLTHESFFPSSQGFLSVDLLFPGTLKWKTKNDYIINIYSNVLETSIAAANCFAVSGHFFMSML